MTEVELLFAGRYVEAVAEYEAMADLGWHIWNYSLCLMNAGRISEARQIYRQRCEEQPGHSDGDYCMRGICEWIQGDFELAVESWRAGLKTAYTDAAGGVLPPALLYFASLYMPGLRKEAVGLLRKAWRRKGMELSWPGPIVGYLLDKISTEDFLVNRTFKNATLELRRKVQAFFWAGVKALERGDPEAQAWFNRCTLIGGAGVLEDERYLALFLSGQVG